MPLRQGVPGRGWCTQSSSAVKGAPAWEFLQEQKEARVQHVTSGSPALMLSSWIPSAFLPLPKVARCLGVCPGVPGSVECPERLGQRRALRPLPGWLRAGPGAP